MRAAVGFILITITLDILGMSLVVPVLAPLIQSMEGGSSIAAAHAIGVFSTSWALMQFIFSPVQGALSDRFGRRPVILLSNAGLGLDYLLMAAAPSIGWLFIGRLISGITAASFSSSAAYITDITPPEKRAARFGLISIAFGFGFVAGPVLGGLLGAINPRLPFVVAAILSLVNFIFGFFILPESLPKERRSAFSWRRANPIGALRLIRSRPGLTPLAAIGFLDLIAQNALPTMIVLYATNRYGFHMHDLALMLGAIGVSSAVVGGGLTGPAVRRFGERACLLGGLLAGAAAFAGMGLSQTGLWFIVALVALSLHGFAQPALTALMTTRVGAHEQGALQGANSSIQGIAGLFGPTIYTESYALAAQPDAAWHEPGMPFLIAAGMLMISALAAFLVARRRAPVVAVAE